MPRWYGVNHLSWVEWLVTSSRSEMVYHGGIGLIVCYGSIGFIAGRE